MEDKIEKKIYIGQIKCEIQNIPAKIIQDIWDTMKTSDIIIVIEKEVKQKCLAQKIISTKSKEKNVLT